MAGANRFLLNVMSKKRNTSGSQITELNEVFMLITEDRYPPKTNTREEIDEAAFEKSQYRISIYMKTAPRKKWRIIYQLKAPSKEPDR